jgi:hypothetical protein
MKETYTTEEFVLVFRTNINRKSDVKSVSRLFDTKDEILKWNVDLSDIDHVLRIEATHSDCAAVIALVTQAGYMCEELTD